MLKYMANKSQHFSGEGYKVKFVTKELKKGDNILFVAALSNLKKRAEENNPCIGEIWLLINYLRLKKRCRTENAIVIASLA
jgi:adenine-specific DNA methylase